MSITPCNIICNNLINICIEKNQCIYTNSFKNSKCVNIDNIDKDILTSINTNMLEIINDKITPKEEITPICILFNTHSQENYIYITDKYVLKIERIYEDYELNVNNKLLEKFKDISIKPLYYDSFYCDEYNKKFILSITEKYKHSDLLNYIILNEKKITNEIMIHLLNQIDLIINTILEKNKFIIDFKLSNIMVIDDNLTLKIFDFSKDVCLTVESNQENNKHFTDLKKISIYTTLIQLTNSKIINNIIIEKIKSLNLTHISNSLIQDMSYLVNFLYTYIKNHMLFIPPENMKTSDTLIKLINNYIDFFKNHIAMNILFNIELNYYIYLYFTYNDNIKINFNMCIIDIIEYTEYTEFIIFNSAISKKLNIYKTLINIVLFMLHPIFKNEIPTENTQKYNNILNKLLYFILHKDIILKDLDNFIISDLNKYLIGIELPNHDNPIDLIINYFDLKNEKIQIKEILSQDYKELNLTPISLKNEIYESTLSLESTKPLILPSTKPLILPSTITFEQKYLKYKNKYLKLKNLY